MNHIATFGVLSAPLLRPRISQEVPNLCHIATPCRHPGNQAVTSKHCISLILGEIEMYLYFKMSTTRQVRCVACLWLGAGSWGLKS